MFAPGTVRYPMHLFGTEVAAWLISLVRRGNVGDPERLGPQ